MGELRLDELQRFVERTFRHVAETKGLAFEIRMDPRLPKSISTDAKRLQQILRNLLSNAFKFTHTGEVNLIIRPASAGWSADNEDLNRAIAEYKKAGDTRIISDAIDSRIARSLRSVDGLLTRGTRAQKQLGALIDRGDYIFGPRQ